VIFCFLSREERFNHGEVRFFFCTILFGC